jgi:hypothetical protein
VEILKVLRDGNKSARFENSRSILNATQDLPIKVGAVTDRVSKAVTALSDAQSKLSPDTEGHHLLENFDNWPNPWMNDL